VLLLAARDALMAVYLIAILYVSPAVTAVVAAAGLVLMLLPAPAAAAQL
jgi:hypothetical protein